MRIFISVVTIRDIGGISTSVINLLNEIKDKYNVTLCVPSNDISPNIVLPSGIQIKEGPHFFRDCFAVRKNLLNQSIWEKTIRTTRRIFKRLVGLEKTAQYASRGFHIDEDYDVAIAFYNDTFDKNGKMIVTGDYNFVLQCVKAKRKIAWIHNDPAKCGFSYTISKKIFFHYDAIVNVSSECKRLFDKIIPDYISKSYVVYNMFDINEIKKMSRQYDNPYKNGDKLHFVTVARLNEEQKKISRVLEACLKLKEDGYTNYDWTIVGEGNDKKDYLKYVNSNKLDEFVSLVGLKSNPYPYMLYADAFVLTSLYEGYPMTVKEAQILTCPTLVTNFGSAKESIIDECEGLIYDNSSDGVYRMMRRILETPAELRNFKDYLESNPVTNEKALSQFDNVCKGLPIYE